MNDFAITCHYQVDSAMRGCVLHDNDVVGVVAVQFLFGEQVAHPAVWERLPQPQRQVVVGLRGVNHAVTFQQGVALA